MERLIVPVLVAALGGGPVSAAPSEAPAGEAGETPPRKTFRESVRTFGADGRYLLTFPTRINRKGAWIAAGVLAGTALLIGRDDEIRREVQESDRRSLDRAADRFEPLGTYLVAGGSLGVLYLVGRGADHPRLASTAAASFEAFLWTAIITGVAKGAFRRERPADGVDAHDFFRDDTIFPSGHTSRSFAIAAVLADRYGGRVVWIAYPIAALVGLATVRQDTHWASDILAGAGLGLAIGKGIAARHPWPPPENPPARAPEARPAGAQGADWQVLPAPGGAVLRITY
ncbi:MAG: phosphatase PAP2 family protein [Acidobacteria bacterium]|nr:phosphatase PAP2 family protein [Acidobacteriota bacterium]